MHKRTTITALALSALLAAGCAPSGLTTTEPNATNTPRQTVTSAPVTSQSPETTPADPPTTTSPAPTTSAPEPTTPEPTTAAPSETVSPPPSTPTTTATPPNGDATALMPGTNHSFAADAYAYEAKDVQAWMRGTAKRPSKKLVFLTFDDGPSSSNTPKLLDALKKAKAPATMFVLGTNVDGAPEALRRSVAEGHSIAIHSYTHNYKALYPGRRGNADRIVEEHDRTLAKLREVLGADFLTHAWRYPGGHMSWKALDAADTALAKRGAFWLDWNAMNGDAEPKKRRPSSASAMVRMATQPIAQNQQVVVLLAHDAPPKSLTLQTLPQIVAAYRDAGYTFAVIK